ncbi:MAG: S-ribosylhomocysteine lyase [Propionibacteriaceae bacterium]|jgi:S-ribosylhomocysteine lyase|nr:S-ribosylhomocysteine lyase [Propionibacteriaceae bacterium]
MEKIASFTIDHNRLAPGLYVSRLDRAGDVTLTTFDLRFTAPNREPVLDQAALHTIEHLGATLLRNDAGWSDRVVYFGPMGCRTGFYLILVGELTSTDALPLVKQVMDGIAAYDGPVPGADAGECGNYLNHDLAMAKFYARAYSRVLASADNTNLNYPE